MGRTGGLPERDFEREARHVLGKLSEPGGRIEPAGEGFGVFVARTRWQRPVARLDRALLERLAARDFLEREGTRPVWRASAAGLAFIRRLDAPDDPFLAQHQVRVATVVRTDEGSATVELNEAESPLVWLHRRRGPDGKPLVTARQLEAGERLRRDFTLGQMGQRVTTDWLLALAPGGERRLAKGPAEASDRAIAARDRVRAALGAVGPDLSDLLIAVCCHLHGLEDAERGFGWPRRAGKVVLLIALDRLAAHYRLPEEKAPQP
jgi:hypothetical protein